MALLSWGGRGGPGSGVGGRVGVRVRVRVGGGGLTLAGLGLTTRGAFGTFHQGVALEITTGTQHCSQQSKYNIELHLPSPVELSVNAFFYVGESY